MPPWAMVQFQLHSNVLVAACMFFFHLHLNLHFRIFTFILFLDFLQLQLDNNDFSCTGCSLSPYFQLLFHPSELFQENHPHSQMHFHKNGIFRAWSWKMYTNCNTIICNIEFAPTIWEEDWEICFSQRFLQMWINFILQSNSWMKEAEGKSYHIIPSWCQERAKRTSNFLLKCSTLQMVGLLSKLCLQPVKGFFNGWNTNFQFCIYWTKLYSENEMFL